MTPKSSAARATRPTIRKVGEKSGWKSSGRMACSCYVGDQTSGRRSTSSRRQVTNKALSGLPTSRGREARLRPQAINRVFGRDRQVGHASTWRRGYPLASAVSRRMRSRFCTKIATTWAVTALLDGRWFRRERPLAILRCPTRRQTDRRAWGWSPDAISGVSSMHLNEKPYRTRHPPLMQPSLTMHRPLLPGVGICQRA